MIKVSIIVPVYNVQEYLEKCLDSLLGQTLKEIEIIVVDDGSTDGSPEIIRRYSEKYSNIKAYRKENGGLADARNYGLPYVTGQYIGFVDSDDYVEPEMYQKLYERAVSDCSVMVECNLFHDYPTGMDTEIGVEYQRKDEILMLGRSVVWNKIYETEWLKKTGVIFEKSLTAAEDINYFAKLVPHMKKISYIEEPCIHYVQRDTSINHATTYHKTIQTVIALQDVLDYYKKNGYMKKYAKPLEFLFVRILLCSSFDRMTKITDKKERKKALQENFQLLNEAFPEWKKNRYLRKMRSLRGVYLKSINSFTYWVYADLFHLASRLKKNHMYH